LEETYVFTAQVGGGGSSGSFVEVKIPDNIISLATANNQAKIVTRAGSGGNGGEGVKNSSTEYAKDGINGSPSWVGIYDGSSLLWALTVPGGKAGSGAKKQSAGINGAKVSENCTYYDSTNPNYNNPNGVSLSCAEIPGSNKSIEGISNGTEGLGGLSVWNEGTTGTYTIGAGGNGGTCLQGSSTDDVTCAQGSSGIGGTIVALHKPSYPGVGGGGGAAGSLLHIKSFQVRPKDLIKVQVGHGGNGGSVNSKGLDGGASKIELISGGASKFKYEVSGGGGGNPGTAGIPELNQLPVSGAGGIESKVAGAKPSDSELFPEKSSDTKGFNAPKYEETDSAGGNGGVNSKISSLAITDGDLNGIPCGGMNMESIAVNKDVIWQCSNNLSPKPLSLSRALSDSSLSAGSVSNIIQNYAPGATGGGGGGWKYGTGAMGGARGLGGYVLIYFGDWSDE